MYTKIKNHVNENKKIYLGASLGAGITFIVLRKNPELLRGSGSELLRGSEARSFFLFSKIEGTQTTKAVTTIHTGERGHSGFITRSLDTGELFSSQKKAAKSFGVSEANLSSHLNGKYPDVSGYRFERLGIII